MRSIAALLTALIVGLGATTPVAAQVTQLEFPRWPAELAPRAPVLSAAIERDFGHRPRWMIYGGQDSLQVLFVNPGLWSSADTSEEIPKESIELAHEAAKHVAKFVWNNFGRDAHLNNLIVRFYRVRRDSYGLPNREVPHGHVEVQFTRQDLESGHLEHGYLSVSIYGGALHPSQQSKATAENAPRPDLARVGGFLWSRYGRDAGINVIRITFVRMRRASTSPMTRELPVQEVTGELTRKQLETGPPQLVSLIMTQHAARCAVTRARGIGMKTVSSDRWRALVWEGCDRTATLDGLSPGIVR